MLISMFVSLLLARKSKGKVFVLLMTAVLILMSVSSIGFPSVWGSYGCDTFWQVNSRTIPLSYPFHVNIFNSRHATINLLRYRTPPTYDMELFLFVFMIDELSLISFQVSHIILLVSFFLLINLVGAVFGYWINKTTLICLEEDYS